MTTSAGGNTVGIESRMRQVLTDDGEGAASPQWILEIGGPQPVSWRCADA